MRALFLIVLACVVSARQQRFDGAEVLRCKLTDDLKPNFSYVIEEINRIDVWGHAPDNMIDIMVRDPAEKAAVLEYFHEGACNVAISNVQDLLDESEEVRMNASVSADWFDDYHNLDETITWWYNLALQYAPYISWTNTIGTTLEGRAMPALKISYSGRNMPWIYFQCQIHAREWVSGSTCQYIINQLMVDLRAGQPQVVNYLSNFNIAVVPVVNPDGYAWTWAPNGNRLWRKNRRQNGPTCNSPTSTSACCGVDLNRNYNDHWGGGGSSADPCSETFRGASVASENEVKATQNYLASLQTTAPIYGSIDWHSYSQLILRPYGWTANNSPSETPMAALGTAMSNAIFTQYNRRYVSEKSIDLYVTTGTASDYFYGNVLLPGNGGFYNYGYTIELRPTTSAPGFQLPPIEIKPTGIENYQAVLTFLNYLLTNPPKV